MKTHLPLLGLVLPLLWGTAAQAQIHERPDSVQRRERCREAARVVSTGSPPERELWAWSYLPSCEPPMRIPAYRAAIRHLRTSADVQRLERALRKAIAFRDGWLFAQVLATAGDRSASVPARVMAFVVLAEIDNPYAHATYEGFVGGLDERGVPRNWCSRTRGHPAGSWVGEVPRPLDFHVQIANLRRRVAADTSEPPDVRSAAACV